MTQVEGLEYPDSGLTAEPQMWPGMESNVPMMMVVPVWPGAPEWPSMAWPSVPEPQQVVQEAVEPAPEAPPPWRRQEMPPPPKKQKVAPKAEVKEEVVEKRVKPSQGVKPSQKPRGEMNLLLWAQRCLV